MPTQKPCGDERRGQCREISNQIDELELRGDKLALIADFVVESSAYPGNGTNEARLDDIRSRRARQVASVDYEEGGRRFLGLSFAGGQLGYARTCNGVSGCLGRAFAFRYDARTRRCQPPRGRVRLLRGYALLPSARTYQVDLDSNALDDLGPSPSSLLTAPLNFRPSGCRA